MYKPHPHPETWAWLGFHSAPPLSEIAGTSGSGGRRNGGAAGRGAAGRRDGVADTSTIASSSIASHPFTSFTFPFHFPIRRIFFSRAPLSPHALGSHELLCFSYLINLCSPFVYSPGLTLGPYDLEVVGHASLFNMSFFGFDTSLPQDRGHDTRAPGFGQASDPFAGLSNRHSADDEEM